MLVKHKGSRFWYVSFMLNGKRVLKSTKTENKALALKIAQAERLKVVEEAKLGTPLEPITLSQALERFVKSREGTPNYKNVRSIADRLMGKKLNKRRDGYEEVFGFDGERELHTFKTADLERLVESRKGEKYSAQHIQHHINTFRSMNAYCEKLGYHTNDKISYPKIKKPKTVLRFLTLDEEKRLLEQLSPMREQRGLKKVQDRDSQYIEQLYDVHDHVIIMLDVGLRYGDAAKLRWDNISLENRTIKVHSTKTDKTFTYMMTDRVVDVLTRRNATKSSQWVFSDSEQNCRKYNPTSLNKAAKRAGIDGFHPHVLRKTFASRLVQAGTSLYAVQQLLMHSSPSTTQIYAAIIPTDVAIDAANVLNKIHK